MCQEKCQEKCQKNVSRKMSRKMCQKNVSKKCQEKCVEAKQRHNLGCQLARCVCRKGYSKSQTELKMCKITSYVLTTYQKGIKKKCSPAHAK